MHPPSKLAEKAQNYLNHLCIEIPNRRVGSAGNREATSFFGELVSSLNFETDYQEFDCIDWSEDGAHLSVETNTFEVLVSPYSLGIEVRAQLIPIENVQQLEKVDAQGKILLLHGDISKEQLMPKSFPFYNPEHHKHIIRTLEAKSPLAIVSATGRDPALAGGLYPFPLIEDGDFDIPSVYMTENEGRRLLNFTGETAIIKSTAVRSPAQGCNVICTKAGKSNKRIVLTAHIDSKDNTPGALDNATGVVTLMLLAELLRDFQGDFALELVAINGEDYYSAIGEVKYLEKNQEVLDEIVLNINMDGIGFHEGGTAFSFYDCTETIQMAVKRVFSAYDELQEGEIWYSGDHMIFVQNGIPAVALTSEHGMTGLAQISHTPKDRPELVDHSKLVTTAMALRDLVVEMDKLPNILKDAD
jgi:aminopeptidase YwaD